MALGLTRQVYTSILFYSSCYWRRDVHFAEKIRGRQPQNPQKRRAALSGAATEPALRLPRSFPNLLRGSSTPPSRRGRARRGWNRLNPVKTPASVASINGLFFCISQPEALPRPVFPALCIFAPRSLNKSDRFSSMFVPSFSNTKPRSCLLLFMSIHVNFVPKRADEFLFVKIESVCFREIP